MIKVITSQNVILLKNLRPHLNFLPSIIKLHLKGHFMVTITERMRQIIFKNILMMKNKSYFKINIYISFSPHRRYIATKKDYTTVFTI